MGCTALTSPKADLSTGAPILNPKSFTFGEVLNCGGFGIVIQATRKIDNCNFALKFFGYTENEPMEEEIDMEIQLMLSLNHLKGVLHLEGIFLDTVSGLIHSSAHPKLIKRAYKVIVMELAHGGDVFDRIKIRGNNITENYLSKSFLTAFEALKEIHDAR